MENEQNGVNRSCEGVVSVKVFIFWPLNIRKGVRCVGADTDIENHT